MYVILHVADVFNNPSGKLISYQSIKINKNVSIKTCLQHLWPSGLHNFILFLYVGSPPWDLLFVSQTKPLIKLSTDTSRCLLLICNDLQLIAQASFMLGDWLVLTALFVITYNITFSWQLSYQFILTVHFICFLVF